MPGAAPWAGWSAGITGSLFQSLEASCPCECPEVRTSQYHSHSLPGLCPRDHQTLEEEDGGRTRYPDLRLPLTLPGWTWVRQIHRRGTPTRPFFPLLSPMGQVVPLVPGQSRVGFSELVLAVVGIPTITGAFGAGNFPTITGLEIPGCKGHWYHPDWQVAFSYQSPVLRVPCGDVCSLVLFLQDMGVSDSVREGRVSFVRILL